MRCITPALGPSAWETREYQPWPQGLNCGCCRDSQASPPPDWQVVLRAPPLRRLLPSDCSSSSTLTGHPRQHRIASNDSRAARLHQAIVQPCQHVVQTHVHLASCPGGRCVCSHALPSGRYVPAFLSAPVFGRHWITGPKPLRCCSL